MFGSSSPVSLSVFVNLNDGLSSNVIVILFASISVFATIPCVLLKLNVPSSFLVTWNSMSFIFEYPSGETVSFNIYVWSIFLASSYAYKFDIVTFPFSPISCVSSIFPVSYFANSFSSFISLNFAPDNRFSAFPFSTFFIVKLYVGIGSFSISIFNVGISLSFVIVTVFIVPSVMFSI